MYKDRKACEYVLRIIMDDEELTVIDNEVQIQEHARSPILIGQ